MISIITPVLNGESFIRHNIESIGQLKIPYEHIIVDGGSTDQTLEIVASYDNVRLIHQNARSGMYGAIQQGIELSSGNYVCWVNCDDVIIPGGFTEMVIRAEQEQIDFMCSDGIFNYVAENRQRMIPGTRFVKYLLRNGIMPFCQPSTIYKRKLYDKVGGMDYKRYRIIGDLDLFYKMAITDAKFGYVPVTSTIFLKYGASLGDKNTALSIREKQDSGYLPGPGVLVRAFYKIIRIIKI